MCFLREKKKINEKSFACVSQIIYFNTMYGNDELVIGKRMINDETSPSLQPKQVQSSHEERHFHSTHPEKDTNETDKSQQQTPIKVCHEVSIKGKS